MVLKISILRTIFNVAYKYPFWVFACFFENEDAGICLICNLIMVQEVWLLWFYIFIKIHSRMWRFKAWDWRACVLWPLCSQIRLPPSGDGRLGSSDSTILWSRLNPSEGLSKSSLHKRALRGVTLSDLQRLVTEFILSSVFFSCPELSFRSISQVMFI